MLVSRRGNGPAVRLPAAVVEALQPKEGDDVQIHVVQIHVLDENAPALARKPGREELVARLREFRGLLPADPVFNRDGANAR